MKKQMKKYFVPALASLLIILVSCDKDEFIRGNNEPVTITRPAEDFSTLVLESHYHVNIIQDSMDMIEVYAESNLLQYIKTYISGTDLVIREKEGFRIDYNIPVTITVHTSNVHYIDILGSGEVFCNYIGNNYLDIDILGSGSVIAFCYTEKVNTSISGSGRIELSGIATEAFYRISGSGDIIASGLTAEECHARISGSGNVYLHALDYLEAIISGSGSIYYKGNPEIESTITGSGQLIHQP